MQQNDYFENKFHCELHPECQLQAVSFQEKYTRKSRLLCMKCTIDNVNKKEIFSQLVYIKDLINDPTNSILRITNLDEREVKTEEKNEVLLRIEKLLVSLEDTIHKQLFIIRQNIQQIRQQVRSLEPELSNSLKLNDLVKKFELIRQMDSYQGTREQAQLEEQLNQISANLTKIYDSAKQKVFDNQKLILQNYQNNFKIIANEVELAIKTSLDLFNKIVQLEVPKIFLDKPKIKQEIDIPKIILDEFKQFPQIHYQISEGKQIKYQLLFQGTRDGMNAKAYWAKCNRQSHLLTIMISKNGNKFGGYSPCLINSALKDYVSDPTLKSFLFQYNKKEIYNLKIQEDAVHCSADFGPAYGRGTDVYIDDDFIFGRSDYLGVSYDISKYNIVDKETHFFGTKSPQLQEVKVFKVIFS